MRAYTTLEESKALVDAGLDPKTADMHYTLAEDYSIFILYADNEVAHNDRVIPCWSLAALLNLLESNRIHYNLMYRSYDTELHIYRYKSPDSYEYSEWFEEPVNAILWLLENKYL